MLGGLGAAAQHGLRVPHCAGRLVSAGWASRKPSPSLNIVPCLLPVLRPLGLQPVGGGTEPDGIWTGGSPLPQGPSQVPSTPGLQAGGEEGHNVLARGDRGRGWR